MLGRAAIAMWWTISAQMKAEFEDWHSHEHMPERLSIPGFLRGTRWIALSGEPAYFILYEAARRSTITSGKYLERLNDPTPWSRKLMPHHLGMVRSLCRVRASFGGGVPGVLATIRFSAAPGRRRSVSHWLATELLPGLPARQGITGAHLLEAHAPGGGPTTEQKIRGGDAMADAIVLLGGYDAEAVKAVLESELSAERFVSHGALPDRIEGLYRPAFSLTARDV
jgi:hypothetical protein